MGIISLICINVLGYIMTLINLEKKYNKILEKVYTILLVGLSMYRSVKIPDTIAYIELYNLYNPNLIYRYEKGFLYLIELFRKLGLNYKVFFGGICLLLIYSCLKFYNFKKNNMVLLLSLFSFYGYYFSLVIIRVGVAFSFGILGFYYYEKNKIKSILFILIAIMFHKSAVVLVLYCIITNKKLEKYKYSLFLIVIGILYFFQLNNLIFDIGVKGSNYIIEHIKYFSTYKSYIIDMKYNTGIYSTRFILNYIVAWIILKIGVRKKFYRSYNLYLIGLFVITIFNKFMFIERVTDYYIILGVFLISDSIFKLKKKLNKVFLITVFNFFNILFLIRIID